MKDKSGRELTGNEILEKGINRGVNIMLEFELFLLRLTGFIPSHLIRKIIYMTAGIKIGKGSTIHTGATFYDVKDIRIGEDTIIGEGTVLDGRDSLHIGSHVELASE